jgi:DNA modification methylase
MCIATGDLIRKSPDMQLRHPECRRAGDPRRRHSTLHEGVSVRDEADVQAHSTLTIAELAAMAAPYNPRKISDHDLESLRNSIRYFGPVEPVVVNTRSQRIVGGHQRVKAAQAEGLDSFPVVFVDLDDPSEKQLNIALNRISGDWDDEKLREVLAEINSSGADLALTGFQDDELERLLRDASDSDADPDEAPESAPRRCEPGDVWQLGAHRLICGDCTDTSIVDLASVDYVFTSPPYGIDLDYERGQSLDDLRALIAAVIENCAAWMSPDSYATFNFADVYRPGSQGFTSMAGAYSEPAQGAGLVLRGNRIWLKPFGRLSLSYGTSTTMNLREWEYIWTFRKGSGKEKLREHGTTLRGVWKSFGDDAVIRDWASFDDTTDKSMHQAAFPVLLPIAGIRSYTDRSGVVLDPFCGSGTTLIACEVERRAGIGIELNPEYCDLTIERWQQFTGREAERIDA